MNPKAVLPFLAGALCASGIAVLVAAGPHDKADPHDSHDPAGMPEMSPEDMMEQMARIGTPAKEHEELGEMVGNWHAKTSFLMDPSAPAVEGEGDMSVQWVLGGRFLKSDFKMNFMGQPFQGLSYMGYDIAHEQYVSIWMDTMSTKITYMTGEKKDGKLTMLGTATTPMGDNPMKLVTTENDDGSMTDQFYDQMPDGTWVNTATITYTRN